MTLEEMKNLSEEDQHILFTEIDGKRALGKRVNFSGVYGVGPPKLKRVLKISLKEAKQIHTGYWVRNKAVKQIANGLITKVVQGQLWLYNPISHFWYSLRAEKDKFSTCNQSSGVFCFDLYIKEVRKRGIKIMFQYHDEIEFALLKEDREEVEDKLNSAIAEVNTQVQLNVPLGISIDFGDTYAETH